MPCLNPLDPQTMRIHDTSGAFQSVLANSGGGQNRCGVLTFPVAASAHPAPRQPRPVCYENHAQDSRVRLLAKDVCPTLGVARTCSPDFSPLVHQRTLAFAIDSDNSNAMKSPNPNSGSRRVEAAPTLTTFDPGPERKHGGVAVVAFTANQRDEVRQVGGSGQVAAALAATAGMKQQTWLLQSTRAATVPKETNERCHA